MEHTSNLQTRCAASVAALNDHMRWQLTPEQHAAYVSAITQLLPVDCTAGMLDQTVVAYHYDHTQVAALRDSHDPQHDLLWAKWRIDVIRVIQHRHFAQIDGSLASLDELTQVALEALHQALPFFGFRSQFSTWVYAIVARSIQRYLKMLNAAKRGKDNTPLDQSSEAYTQTLAAHQPDDQVAGDLLRVLIYAVLTHHADERMAQIFDMWASGDQRMVDIGKKVGLSAGRVSVLISQAQILLQQHPQILQWVMDEEMSDVHALGE